MLGTCTKCGADVEGEGTYDAEKFGPLICLKCAKEKKYFCQHCGKEAPWAHNYCSSECHFAAARADGWVEYLPNGLPPCCISASGLILEHEHGDHIDYKFPVDVDFIGKIDDDDRKEYAMLSGGKESTDKAVRKYKSEWHALIYTDGSIAVTIYECCYSSWYLKDGSLMGGPSWMSKDNFRLNEESRKKVIAYAEKRMSEHEQIKR